MTSRKELDQKVEAAFQRHRRGELHHAGAVYQSALAECPEHPAALHYFGLILQQTGRSAEGAKLLERALLAGGPDKRIQNHLGQIYFALGETQRSVACFERALDLDPAYVEALNNLANVVRVRDLDRAIALYRRALDLAPNAAYAAYNLAQALDEDGAFDEAVQLYRRVIAIDPRHLSARHSLGVLLEQQGAFDGAVAQYLEVLKLDPRHGASLANLIAIRHFEPGPQLVLGAERRLLAADVPHEERIKLHQGLGKHYDRMGDFDLAFAHFERSKSLLKSQTPAFDITQASRILARTAAAFPRTIFRPGSGRSSERPVFIVGLPRSGTTLVEQILASHPQVFGAGELREMPRIVKLLRPDYPECVASMSPAELSALADAYLDVLAALAPAEARRVTDKLPLNSVNLGMIGVLFPRAKIIHCRRDPLDVAVSCYVELFDMEHDYTGDFADFGRYFLEHERLMDHWRTVLPTPMLDVRYEDVVSDLEGASRAMIAFLGLEWDPACLNFQRTERTVQTPSRWQVRQPIYSSSVGRWRNYGARLDPLRAILAQSGFDYGAGRGPEGRLPTVRPRVEPPAPRPPALRRPIFIVAAPRSGSTLLFETLAVSRSLSTVGGEAHWLVEGIRELSPGADGVDSNRLTAAHATPSRGRYIVEHILAALVDHAGDPVAADSSLVFLEKTPKNALRIPFFNAIFPDARFIFLWRDPRENLSSIMQAWRSGKFRTYKDPEAFDGPWSLLLPPGYASLRGRPLEEIAAFQWKETNRIILEDLESLGSDRWIVADYESLLSDPGATVARLLSFTGLTLDAALEQRVSGPLPHARYTQTAPAAHKWRVDEEAILRVLPSVEPVWDRLAAWNASLLTR